MAPDSPSATQDPNLLEREAELAALEAALDAAVGGRGSVVAIEGPPGIGKSSLVGSCRELARQRDMYTVSVRATELERSYPYGIVRQTGDSVALDKTPEELEAVLAGAAKLALPILNPGGSEDLDNPELMYQRLHGLYWMTANLAREQPLLITIDDAQWADEASMAAERFLSLRIADLPMVLLLAVRTADQDRATFGLNGEPAVSLSADGSCASVLVEVGASSFGRPHQAREVPARVQERAVRHDQRAEVRIAADLLADGVARDDRGLDTHGGQTRLGVMQLLDVGWRVGELEVANLAEIAIDRLVDDQALDGGVAIEGFLVQEQTGFRAVTPNQLRRAPLVAGMHDAAIARGRAIPKVPGFDERDGHASPGQFTRRVDPAVAPTDDDHVGHVGEWPARPRRQLRHRRLPERPLLVVGVERGRHPPNDTRPPGVVV
jgi:hypothetical protein